MAVRTLNADEIVLVKQELGFNVLNVAAEPSIGVDYVTTIIQQNTWSSSTDPTTSTTAITTPGPGSIVLASATGISQATMLFVDCDEDGERVRVKAISGSTIFANFRKTHAGTYPVEILSPLMIVRDLLYRLTRAAELIQEGGYSAGLKKADEVEWFEGKTLADLRRLQYDWRLELANVCGVPVQVGAGGMSSGGGSMEVY